MFKVAATAIKNTFRDLHSSQETLNGREVFCRLRLPVPSSPSASEASSSLQVSSSLRSAAFPDESSLPEVRLVLVDMVVGGAGQKEPRGREARGFIAFARLDQPRTQCAKCSRACCKWTPDVPSRLSSPPELHRQMPIVLRRTTS
jgi:hypothetical protein